MVSRIDKAYIFGSRARGDFHETSDIDIALKGDLSAEDMSLLRTRFEESSLIYTVDLVHWDQLKSEDLKKEIQNEGVVL